MRAIEARCTAILLGWGSHLWLREKYGDLSVAFYSKVLEAFWGGVCQSLGTFTDLKMLPFVSVW